MFSDVLRMIRSSREGTRMNKKVLIGGIICGIICALCVFGYTYLVYQDADSARVEAMERYGGEQVEVLDAKRATFILAKLLILQIQK